MRQINRQRIANNIRYLRWGRGLTTQKLGCKIGIPFGMLSSYERGVNIPGTIALLKLAEFYSISIETILRGKVRKVKNPIKKGRKPYLF